MSKTAFIGAGSMAEAIFSGMISRGGVDPSTIYTSNRTNTARLDELQEQYGVTGCQSLEKLLTGADIVVLAVKPKDVLTVLSAARPYITEEMMVISVAAGVDIASLEGIISKKVSIIRAMPNTSATVGKSATAIAANKQTKEKNLAEAIALFNAIGTVSLVDESQLDAVTGLSGSGPAYIYYLVEAMEKSAGAIGLDTDTAKQLIIQTLIGAAEMVNQSSKTAYQLRKEVTSPGGTTEAGLKVLAAHQVQEAFVNCIQEAAMQSKRMGRQISEEIEESLLKKESL